jgi:hypothetical protein
MIITINGAVDVTIAQFILRDNIFVSVYRHDDITKSPPDRPLTEKELAELKTHYLYGDIEIYKTILSVYDKIFKPKMTPKYIRLAIHLYFQSEYTPAENKLWPIDMKQLVSMVKKCGFADIGEVAKKWKRNLDRGVFIKLLLYTEHIPNVIPINEQYWKELLATRRNNTRLFDVMPIR